MRLRTVSVIGLGYVGLPTAAVLAARGVDVIGVDVDPRVVETVGRGDIHIVEPALDRAVREAVASGALRAAVRPEPADAFMIAVPTPATADRRADLRFVFAAADSIAPVLKRGDLVVLESTSPVGTTEAVCARLAEARPDLRIPVRGEEGPFDLFVAYCPERVLPGKVVEEIVANDRAVGGVTRACAERAAELYRLFTTGELVLTDARSAELCKLAENAYRDVNIAFANELANVCEGLDLDVWEVVRLANRHPRVGILRPGPGVGGHCVAVDPWFLVEAAPDDTPLIRAARQVNDQRPSRTAARIEAEVAAHILRTGKAPTVALLGLAFKADIDDLRESPSVEVAFELVGATGAAAVLAVEPNVDAPPAALAAAGVELVSLEDALARAQIVALLTDHAQFRALDPARLAGKAVVDTRGAWEGRAGAGRAAMASPTPAK